MAGEAGGGRPDPAPEREMRERLARELGRLAVGAVLLHAAFTLSSLGSVRLGLAPETTDLRDLAEARRAIDALAALVPALAKALPEDAVAGVREALAGLQLAYARTMEQEAAPAQ